MAVTISTNAAIAASLKAGACCCFLYTAVASKCPACNSVSSSLEDRLPKASVVPIKESDHEEPEHRSTDQHLENGWQVESTIEKPRAAFSLSLDKILGRKDSTTRLDNNQYPMSESNLPPNTAYMAPPAKEQYRVQSKAGPGWLRKKFGLSHDTKAATTEGVGLFRRSSPQAREGLDEDRERSTTKVTEKHSHYITSGPTGHHNDLRLFDFGLSRPQRAHRPISGQRRRRCLPLYINGTSLDTTADTGSSENGMDWATAAKLGLRLQPCDPGTGNFVLANGTPFKSIGQVETCCSFGNESNHKQEYSIKFNVFRRLATSVVVGLQFLTETLTLTNHQHRFEQRLEAFGGPCRIMHFNRPSKGLPCYVNDELVNANADTGADMNLATPAMARRCLKKGRKLQEENLEVEYADGSPGMIRASFTATLNPDTHYSDSPDAVETTFYVLEGLTSTALLGHETLEVVDAFVRYEDAFIDMPVHGNAQPFDLIFWGKSYFANIIARKRTAGIEQRNGPGESDHYALPNPSSSENSFRQGLATADAREDNRRSTTEYDIRRSPGSQWDSVLALESERRRKYIDARKRCVAEHHTVQAGRSLGAIT